LALSESKQPLTATQISEKIGARGRSDSITMSVLGTLKQEDPEMYRQIYVPSTRNISQFGNISRWHEKLRNAASYV
jgi:hypothetical protein